MHIELLIRFERDLDFQLARICNYRLDFCPKIGLAGGGQLGRLAL